MRRQSIKKDKLLDVKAVIAIIGIACLMVLSFVFILLAWPFLMIYHSIDWRHHNEFKRRETKQSR